MPRPLRTLPLAVLIACAQLPPAAPSRVLVAQPPRIVPALGGVPSSAPDLLRRALRGGAPIDSDHAVVMDGGDLVRLDLTTGATRRLERDVVAGAQCVAIPLAADVVFACGRAPHDGYTGEGILFAHALQGVSQEATFIEGRFVVSDDGGIAANPLRPMHACDLRRAPGFDRWGPHDAVNTACVRAADGSWHPYGADAPSGAPVIPPAWPGGWQYAPRFVPVRCIPRGDGAAAVVVRAIDGAVDAWGLVDVSTGALHPWHTGLDATFYREAFDAALGTPGLVEDMPLAPRAWNWECDDLCVDRDWSLDDSGRLIGWARSDGAWSRVEISPDGAVRRGAPRFAALARGGPVAVGRTLEGRVVQTLDHGLTWREVAGADGVPSGVWSSGVAGACSLLGCDLGTFYRIGWTPDEPLRPIREP
jgi:hypothetical protein